MEDERKETSSEESNLRLKDLKIDKGARHVRILDEDGETVFRTTNVRDAERFLELVEENRRLHHLLEARGIAPHRIYRVDGDEHRQEVAIVAKHGADSVVVRNLADGREDIVDLEDVLPIADVDYHIGSEAPVETVHISVRVDRENEVAILCANRSFEGARTAEASWRKSTFDVEKADQVPASWTSSDCVIFTEEIVLED